MEAKLSEPDENGTVVALVKAHLGSVEVVSEPTVEGGKVTITKVKVCDVTGIVNSILVNFILYWHWYL